MKKIKYPIYLLLSVVVLFASCLESDDTEFVLHDDAAITSFRLTSAKRLMHTTSSKGEDSTYYVSTTSVTSAIFSIDHQKGEIFNLDSLDFGIDPSRMLCEYASMNNGMVGIENEVGDSVSYLQTTDTIDFSKPRYLRMYSSDNSTSRRYKVTVNVHQEQADLFKWTRMADEPNFAAMQHLRTLTLGENVVILGCDGVKTGVFVNAPAGVGTWTEVASLGVEASKNAVVKGDTLFVVDGSMLKWSLDAVVFYDAAEVTGIKRLVGACLTELYAYDTDGNLIVSKDGGKTWTADAISDDKAFLPQQDMDYDCSVFGYNDDTDCVVLVGNRSVTDFPDDATAVVWRKLVEYVPGSMQHEWSYIDFASSSIYPLPRLSGLQVFSYDNNLLAIGGSVVGNGKEEQTKIYESRDGGITWKSNAIYPLPKEFDSAATAYAVTVDADNFIWIVCAGTGQVWRGRLNKMGWVER